MRLPPRTLVVTTLIAPLGALPRPERQGRRAQPVPVLASAGLAWSDVKVVPVPAVDDGVDALVQGRADVTEHALGAAKTKALNP